MAFTATTSVERTKITAARLLTFKSNPATTIKAGDMLMWDAATKVATPITAVTEGSEFIGVSDDQNPIASLGDTISKVRVGTHGIYKFKATNGETYVHGDALVVDGDAQTVRLQGAAAAADVIGFAYLPEVDSVVAGATTEIEVVIRVNFPGFGLFI